MNRTTQPAIQKRCENVACRRLYEPKKIEQRFCGIACKAGAPQALVDLETVCAAILGVEKQARYAAKQTARLLDRGLPRGFKLSDDDHQLLARARVEADNGQLTVDCARALGRLLSSLGPACRRRQPLRVRPPDGR